MFEAISIFSNLQIADLPPSFAVFVLVSAFLIGACFGSFLNVCIYRIPAEISLSSPGSRCPKCETPIKWYDNVPILGWLSLRGKCRACGVSIAPRYMIVETMTGGLFLFVAYKFGLTWHTPIYWLVVFGLLLGTFVDLDERWIPDRVTIGGILLGLFVSPLYPELHGFSTWQHGLMAAFAGGAIGFGLLLSVEALGLMVFKKPAMGHGDTKLLAAIGCFLGWKAVLLTLICAAFIGSVGGITAGLVSGKGWRNYYIPFGPFIAAGALIWMFWGPDLWNGYMNLLRPQGMVVDGL